MGCELIYYFWKIFSPGTRELPSVVCISAFSIFDVHSSLQFCNAAGSSTLKYPAGKFHFRLSNRIYFQTSGFFLCIKEFTDFVYGPEASTALSISRPISAKFYFDFKSDHCHFKSNRVDFIGLLFC